MKEKLTYMQKESNKCNRINSTETDLYVKRNLIYDRGEIAITVQMMISTTNNSGMTGYSHGK